jgi:hypothetical protein
VVIRCDLGPCLGPGFHLHDDAAGILRYELRQHLGSIFLADTIFYDTTQDTATTAFWRIYWRISLIYTNGRHNRELFALYFGFTCFLRSSLFLLSLINNYKGNGHRRSGG